MHSRVCPAYLVVFDDPGAPEVTPLDDLLNLGAVVPAHTHTQASLSLCLRVTACGCLWLSVAVCLSVSRLAEDGPQVVHRDVPRVVDVEPTHTNIHTSINPAVHLEDTTMTVLTSGRPLE